MSRCMPMFLGRRPVPLPSLLLHLFRILAISTWLHCLRLLLLSPSTTRPGVSPVPPATTVVSGAIYLDIAESANRMNDEPTLIFLAVIDANSTTLTSSPSRIPHAVPSLRRTPWMNNAAHALEDAVRLPRAVDLHLPFARLLDSLKPTRKTKRSSFWRENCVIREKYKSSCATIKHVDCIRRRR